MKKTAIFILLIMTFMSCTDILDLTPKNSLSDADFWTNEAAIQGYVDYAYHMLNEYTATNVKDGRMMSWGHFRAEACDEAHPHILWGGGLEITDNKLNPSSASSIGSWYDNYQIIQHINIFFDYYEKGRFNVPEAKLKLWMAEMHFIRAYCYNQMIKAYDGVIITKKPFTSDDPVDQVRASYDECVAFILEEINESLKGLPTVEALAGRLSIGAALGLKAQVLLHAASPLHNPSNDKAKWTAAAAAAKAVIDLPQYSLYKPADYRNVFFHTKSKGNTEIILSKHARAMSGELINMFNFPSTLFGPPSFGGWGLATPIQQLVDDFQMADGTPYDRTKHGAAPYQNRELRFYASILYDGAEYSKTMPRVPETTKLNPDGSLVGYKVESGTYKYKDATGAIKTRNGYDRLGGVLQETKNYTRTGYYCHKYVRDDVTTKFNVGEPVQMVMMRLTEFYLMYAECLVNLDRGAEARDYLLPIRRRVGLPDASLPAVITMKEVMQERRTELCFEGQRFFDVRRWKILEPTFKDVYGVNVANDQTVTPATATYTYFKVQTRTYNEKLYYMPIPQTEINKNPLLEQNPGY